jgi:hypothetical protein
MKKFYCPELNVELDRTMVRAKQIATAVGGKDYSVTFCNKSKYFYIKNSIALEVKALIY